MPSIHERIRNSRLAALIFINIYALIIFINTDAKSLSYLGQTYSLYLIIHNKLCYRRFLITNRQEHLNCFLFFRQNNMALKLIQQDLTFDINVNLIYYLCFGLVRFGLISLFDATSTFMGYLVQKPSLWKESSWGNK